MPGTVREWLILEAPSSVGAHHAGQERTPIVLHDLGLVQRLEAAGVHVARVSRLPVTPFADAERQRDGRDAARVVEVALTVADEVASAIADGLDVLVVGGDCTLSVGAVAGLLRHEPDLALAYLDGDADLADPATSSGGILDATGAGSLLDLHDRSLGHIGPTRPLLRGSQVALLGYDETDPGTFDAELLAAAGLAITAPDHALRADPAGVAARTRTWMESATVSAVHFDVDSIDSGQLPLANFPHYGTGIGLDDARLVLPQLCAATNLRLLSLTEVNPGHDTTGVYLERYLDLVTSAVARAVP